MEHIEINPPGRAATHTIIWLHGLGADGNDFAGIAHKLHFPNTMGMRYILPHAPIMPITINNGYQMRAWFDIVDLSRLAKFDEAGIERSVKAIESLIAKEEARGIPSNHIFLAGFSQGAVIALTTGITYKKPLAGIIALSGYLPNAAHVIEQASLTNKTIPIFLAHGTQDGIVPFMLGEETHQVLEQANFPVSWHRYAMEHSVCVEEIRDINGWLVQLTTE
jgi:phospholipase/carboxylesterase